MMIPFLRHRALRALAITAVGLAGCRGAAPGDPAEMTSARLAHLVDSLMPAVSAASGLAFRSTPKAEVRSVEELRTFLLDKLHHELPPAKLEGIGGAYRLLGLIPDTLDLTALFEALYKEQVAGYYDPDSSALYFVSRGEPTQATFLLAHELTHALQHQHTSVDSIMKDRSDGDRAAAAQAVLEGHAQLAAIITLVPGQDVIGDPTFLGTVEESVRGSMNASPVFATAPLVIREGLIAPYLKGTEFVRWFRQTHPGQQPFGPRMPQSTEQLLHPSRYAAGDLPLRVRFADSSADVLHEDTFGELEIAALRTVVGGLDGVHTEVAMEWGGDRYRVHRTPHGPALVWYTAWDTPGGAKRFVHQVTDRLLTRKRPGYRTEIDTTPLDGRSGVRVVIAPLKWSGWAAVPKAKIESRGG